MFRCIVSLPEASAMLQSQSLSWMSDQFVEWDLVQKKAARIVRCMGYRSCQFFVCTMAPAAGSSSLRPAKAAHRYRPGQAPKGYDDERDSAESSDEDDENEGQTRAKKQPVKQQQRNDGLTVLNEGQKLPTATQKQQASRPITVQVTKELGQGAAASSSEGAANT
jgi:hypothetical protein